MYAGCYNTTSSGGGSESTVDSHGVAEEVVVDQDDGSLTLDKCIEMCLVRGYTTIAVTGHEPPYRSPWTAYCRCGLGVIAAAVRADDALCNARCPGNPAQKCGGFWDDAPGGGGYLPTRCRVSARFSADHATRTSTFPGRRVGRGRWERTHAPETARTARMVGGYTQQRRRRRRRKRLAPPVRV